MAVLLTGAAMVSAVAVFSGAWKYVSGLENKPEAHLVSGSETAVDLDLLGQIEAAAAKSRIEPVDARVDSVWKAIPGYNGLEVDIEATYKAASSKKRKAGDAIPYVYRQIPAKVTLDDLGEQPIYRGNPSKPMVSMMINVAWGMNFWCRC